MPDDNVQLPDPSQYATPNQLEAQRAVAKALLSQGMGTITPSNGGAVSGFQGIAGGLGTLAGRYQLNKAAEQERLNNLGAEKTPPPAPGEQPQQPASPGSVGGPLSTQPPSGNAVGYSDPVSKYAA